MRDTATSSKSERLFVPLAAAACGVLVAGTLTTGIASDAALLVLGAAAGVYIHRLRRHVTRLRSVADELRMVRIERAELISDFERARRTDDVTGLGNRQHLDAALPRLVTEAGWTLSSLAVLVLELEGLAAYRDRYGEGAGNRALKTLAGDWQGHMRINDVLVRVSADEFVAVLPACSPPNAERVAERLVASSPPEMSCSVGIASWDGSERYEQLLRRAEQATRAAEKSGERVLVAD